MDPGRPRSRWPGASHNSAIAQARRTKCCLDGRKLDLDATRAPTRELLLYHKPVGEMTTRSDPQGRPTVFERLPQPRAAAGSRLADWTSIPPGLLLFTTDGELAHRLMHPSSEIDREYLVRIRGRPSAIRDPATARGRDARGRPRSIRRHRPGRDRRQSHHFPRRAARGTQSRSAPDLERDRLRGEPADADPVRADRAPSRPPSWRLARWRTPKPQGGWPSRSTFRRTDVPACGDVLRAAARHANCGKGGASRSRRERMQISVNCDDHTAATMS